MAVVSAEGSGQRRGWRQVVRRGSGGLLRRRRVAAVNWECSSVGQRAATGLLNGLRGARQGWLKCGGGGGERPHVGDQWAGHGWARTGLRCWIRVAINRPHVVWMPACALGLVLRVYRLTALHTERRGGRGCKEPGGRSQKNEWRPGGRDALRKLCWGRAMAAGAPLAGSH